MSKEKSKLKYKLKLQKKIVVGFDDRKSAIEFINLFYVYNRKTPYEFAALNNINTHIKPGIITAIIGATGSGKSTLIQHINGLLIPQKGKIRIGTFEINSKTKKIRDIKSLRKTIGLVFQFPEYQLFEDTVLKDVMFGAMNMGIERIKALDIAEKYLHIVGLPEQLYNNSPFNLSGGEKRRVAIAGILALEGNTLILDEPTAGLDPQGEKDFIALFRKLNTENKKRIVIISHNMDNVLEIADEVILMDKGKVVFVGSPFKIFQDINLINKFQIEIPKIYKIINKLNNNGFDFKHKKIRTIQELSQEIAMQIKGG